MYFAVYQWQKKDPNMTERTAMASSKQGQSDKEMIVRD